MIADDLTHAHVSKNIKINRPRPTAAVSCSKTRDFTQNVFESCIKRH